MLSVSSSAGPLAPGTRPAGPSPPRPPRLLPRALCPSGSSSPPRPPASPPPRLLPPGSLPPAGSSAAPGSQPRGDFRCPRATRPAGVFRLPLASVPVVLVVWLLRGGGTPSLPFPVPPSWVQVPSRGLWRPGEASCWGFSGCWGFLGRVLVCFCLFLSPRVSSSLFVVRVVLFCLVPCLPYPWGGSSLPLRAYH